MEFLKIHHQKNKRKTGSGIMHFFKNHHQVREEEHDFSKGSVAGIILRLALPLIVAQFINVLYNIVDRIYIGRIPGASSAALTGVGVAFPVITAITAFSNLVGTGGPPLCSIARGKGDEERAEGIMGTSFTITLITGGILILVGMAVKEPLLYALGASDATFGYADDYISIYLIGTIFVMISLGMNSFINSQGFSGTGMLTVLLGAVVNIILDPIFIFAFNMGVRGAALATVISQGLSALWVLCFLTGKKAIYRISFCSMRLNFKLLREIAALGSSGFIMAVTNGGVQVVCNATLSTYGGDLYVGIMTVINSVREILTLPVNGITNGAQPVLGFNYGAGKYRRVRQGIRFTSIVCIVYTVIAWVCTFLFPEQFIHMFNSDPALIDKGVPALHLYFFGFFMMSLQFAGQSVFVALGRSKQAVFFSLFRKAIIVIPLTIFLPMVGGLGVNGVFLAEPISNFIGGGACFCTMMLTIWPMLRQEPSESV